MPKITKTEIVNAGYGCDWCGTLISDGKSDGCGGINWWGFTIGLDDMGKETVEATREWNGVKVYIRHQYENTKRWAFCKDCAKDIEDFIRKRVKEEKS
jgi:hypothetical protein